MKTIGIIGGLTWVSSLDYYRLINEKINKALGGSEAAKIILFSVNFGEIKKLTEAGEWALIENIMVNAAKKLEQAGADCILIGANTMHRFANEIQDAIDIPLIHVAKETAKLISAMQLDTVALLGTKYTMQLDFFNDTLSREGIATIIPGEDDINYINNAIYTEMSRALFLPETKARFIKIINELIGKGAEGVILGCTEIPILIKQEDCAVPVFDTTDIHAEAAVKFALSS